jgi:hypothetical protein
MDAKEQLYAAGGFLLRAYLKSPRLSKKDKIICKN